MLKKAIPVAQRVLGPSHETTFRMRGCYAEALCNDEGATLDDLREAATTFEDVGRIAQRVLGGAHPLASDTQRSLEVVRAALAVREA